MTVKELYEYCKEKGIEDYTLYAYMYDSHYEVEGKDIEPNDEDKTIWL